ncbi:hypothetical protein Tco_0467492, partial [Tanacetum coccineum]
KQKVKDEKVVSTAEVATIDATATTVDELTLAQTLIEIKAAKPKVVTTVATITTTAITRPKARGVVVQEPTRTKRIKKQKIDDDQEEAEIKNHMEIVVGEEEIAVDAIPLATKPPIIVDWKIIKEGKMGYFQIIRANGSSRRPEETYERVLWGDLKVMFEPDVESDVWRNLQGYNVTVWKLFSSSGVYFMRFQNLHIFILVEKKYPLTPTTITKMLNKKLQTDHWNEMCYQLLKLMTKQGRIVGIKRLHDDLGVNTAKGEYDMWRLRIEKYFQVKDYALWDVIENGNSFKPAAKITTNDDGTSTTLIPGPVTTEENVQKKNDMKARSMLPMALPNEHLMTFNQYKNAKTLFAAIQTRFYGNEATKKTQKTLLNQMYENFSAPSTESLDSIFNRLQKIVSQLAILGENISQEDLNLKFLRSLPSEWNIHIVVWRNKPDLDTMSFDNLYNNFKIVEQEVKRTASSRSSSQNVAFVLSTSSTNKVNTAHGVSTANSQVSPASTQVSTASTQDLEQVHEDDLEEMDLKWQLALLSMMIRKFFQKTSRKITINGSDTAGYDKSKVKCFNCHKLAIDGAGFDWRFMADEEVPTNMALMAFSGFEIHNDKTCSKTCLKSFETFKTQLDDLRIEFNKSEFNLATYKRGLASVEEQLVFYKKNEVLFCEQLAVLKRDISYKHSEISVLKSELEKLKQEKESNQLKIENFDNASKSLDKLIGSQIPDKSRKGLGFVSYNVVLPPPTRLFLSSNLDLSNSGLEEFQQSEFEGYGPKTSKSVSEDTSNGLGNLLMPH